MTDLMESWAPGSEDAIGQAGEFLVWAVLISQSGGGLHVFLTMLDRGIDGLVHRLADGAYLAVQVKSKTEPHSNEAPIAVLDSHLYTADQLVIGVHLVNGRLGDYALVADGATFRAKAGHVVDRGRALLVADMPFRPIPGHKWSEDLVPTSDFPNGVFTRHASSSRPRLCLRSPAPAGPYYELHFRPDGSIESSKVDRFRIPLDSLAAEVSKRL